MVIFFMEDIKVLNEMYKIVAMGIIGIDEVKGHIINKKFAKTMIDAKKKYQAYKINISKTLENFGEKPTEINLVIKMFNDIYTNMQLVRNDDSKIAKMLIEGTNKGIIKVEEILNYDLDKRAQKIATDLLNLLEYQINEWKVYL